MAYRQGLTPEQEIEAARMEMEEAGRRLQELKGGARPVPMPTMEGDSGAVPMPTMEDDPNAISLPGTPGYLSNERRYAIGGQPLAPVQPRPSMVKPIYFTPEAELRAEYDRQMEQDRQRVLEERRLGEAGDKRYAKFDPSGYRHPQTPMPAEKGTAAYESGYNRWSSDVYKAQKKAGEALQNRRLKVKATEAGIDESKAKAEKDRRGAHVPYGETPSGYREGLRSKEKIAESKTPEISAIDKEKLKDLRSKYEDAITPEDKAKHQADIDSVYDKYKSQQSGGGLREKAQQPVVFYKWKDSKGQTHMSNTHNDAPENAEITINGESSDKYVGRQIKKFNAKSPEEQSTVIQNIEAEIKNGSVDGLEKMLRERFLKAVKKGEEPEVIFKPPKGKRSLREKALSGAGGSFDRQKLTIGDIPGVTQAGAAKIASVVKSAVSSGQKITQDVLRQMIKDSGVVVDLTDRQITKLWNQFKNIELPGQ